MCVRNKKKSGSDKLMDYTLKNAEHLHFLLCTGMLDIYFIKKYKNKIKKTPTIQNNSLRGENGVGGGNLSLLQSESPGSTANDQSTASHCSVEGTGHSGSDPGCQ